MMPNKDDRSNNAERLEEMITNTTEKMKEAEKLVQEHGKEMTENDLEQIAKKNENREVSIEAMRQEVEDERTE
ncbi:small acid-soluble spore protein (thioredoxin-like protein) [Alkalihalobacillus xiaoxiensis]|uniref:Small, acid-soluble spore protein Tlp n=1 Tax=Shouchella xiaoxiensis TaxID=766895 RepID=A0ABS2SYZ8_9BACI|nr:small acid-soluble spore protein Tlp [Shouchella xiaoxiensis]MBM7840756.1 small acid-soluble spore protein (thioredoxin-like protein) [Shouchella xiaoxiensis]